MKPTSSKIDNNIIFLPAGADEVEVPARVYGLEGRKNPVIMLHGLQSHSGWFTQSATFISELGHPVYAIDRQASGLSEAPKDWKDMELLGFIEDVETAAVFSMLEHKKRSVHIVGHCLGALGAAAFCESRPEIVKSLVLPTPGLFTKTDMSTPEKMQIALSVLTGKEHPMRVPLEAELFSEKKEYVEFIKNDALSLREASTHFYYELSRLRKYVKKYSRKLTMPVFMALAGEDQICDNFKNVRFFSGLKNRRNVLKEYIRAKHILEYSLDRENFFSDLARWLIVMEEE